MSNFKINCTIAFLLTVVLGLGLVNDYNKTRSSYTDNQVVTHPTVVREQCVPRQLGSYSRATKVLTICDGFTKEQDEQTYKHEMIHFYQDLEDGLDNTTNLVISGESVVQKIWDDETLFPELKEHIKNYYEPHSYLTELEAYILENYPLGNVLTYTEE